MAARPYRRAASVKVKIAMAKKTPLSQSDTGARAPGGRRRRTSSTGPSHAEAAALAQRSAATLDDGEQEPTRDEIARRAYFRFLQRGGEPGYDQEDWFAAESELKRTL